MYSRLEDKEESCEVSVVTHRRWMCLLFAVSVIATVRLRFYG